MNNLLKLFFICIISVTSSSQAREIQQDLAARLQNLNLLEISQEIELLDRILMLNTMVFRSVPNPIYSDHASSIVYIQTEESLGSGVVINDNGDILTNAHLIVDAKEVFVVFKPVKGLNVPISEIHEAKIIKIDRMRDLALIQPLFPPSNINPITILNSDQINEEIIGSAAHCIGHPDGLTWTYTKGIVSSYRENYDWPYYTDKLIADVDLTDEERNLEYEKSKMHRANLIQIDCSINPGNSGGALIDDDGFLLGLNTFMMIENTLINFAVAANELNHFLLSDKFKKPVSVKAFMESSGKENLLEKKDTNDDGLNDEEYWDNTGNKILDTIYFDEDYDGNYDFVLIDLNENGLIDGKYLPSKNSKEIKMYYDIDEDGDWDAVHIDKDNDGDYEIKRKLIDSPKISQKRYNCFQTL